MKVRYVTYIFLATLGASIAFGHQAFAQTRLGLHVTQEELNIWRQRSTDSANGVNGYSFQSIYQNRILADANKFRSQSHPGGDGFWVGYTGAGCVPVNDPSVIPAGTPFFRGNGAYMMRSAFNFMLTGDRSYADPVRTELLNQIAQAGTNWSNTSKWCYTQLGGKNFLEIIPWVVRLMVAFDYLNAGGYAGFSAAEKTNITNWLHSAATLFDKAQVDVVVNRSSMYPGIYNIPQNLACNGCPGTSQGAIYFGGPTSYNPTYFTYFNQLVHGPVLSMGMGLMANDSTLINHAVAYQTAFMKAGIFDDGSISDFKRWADCNPECPRSMWGHAFGAVNGLIAIADMYARSGNTSLYTLTGPTQVFGGKGGTVGLQSVVGLLAGMTNRTVSYYGTTSSSELDDAHLLTWNPTGQGDSYWDFGIMVANLFYRDSAIRTAMTRNLVSGNTSASCVDPQMAGCFSGDYSGMWADLPFMFGQMEGKVNPYSGTTTTPPPLGSGVTVDSTYTGWTTVPIDDGIINAAGGTATTWASANSATADHWINIALPLAQQINTATIYWAYNSFQQKYMTSQRVDVQYWNGSSYVTAATITYPGSDIPSSTVSFPAITTSQIRFYQAANQGNPTYPGVLWVTEVDYASKPAPSAPTALQVSLTP